MYLKELDFNFDFKDYREYINELKDKEVEFTKEEIIEQYKQENRKFRLETRCITSYFEREMKKFKNDKYWKILINCTKHKNDFLLKNFTGICDLELEYNVKEFFKLNLIEKKIVTLNLLMQGLEIVSKKEEWNMEEFYKIRDIIIDSNYENIWKWSRAKKSPNKKYKAELILNHDVEVIEFILKITTKEKSWEKIILKEIPDEFKYVKYLGELKWEDEGKIVLKPKNKGENIEIYLQDVISNN